MNLRTQLMVEECEPIHGYIITASSDDLVDLKRARSAGTILHLENRLAPFLAGVNDGCLEVGGDIILEARAQPPRSLGRQMGLDEASAKAGGKAVERAGEMGERPALGAGAESGDGRSQTAP
jgi:hypothetical protein